MKSLCTLLALLVAVPLSAQTVKVAPIEAIRIIVQPAGPVSADPIDQALHAITPAVPFCNQPEVPIMSSNSKMVDVSDPFHPGKYCTFQIPTTKLDAGDYQVTATYESITITECQDTNGTKVPCATPRFVPAPFAWTVIWTPPQSAAPLVVRPR